MNYVTGERIQELAEYSIVLNTGLNGLTRLFQDQFKNTKSKWCFFNESVGRIPEEVLQAKSLFVYTQILPFFFDKIYPHLSNRFVLITHNSDYGITEDYRRFLDENKIIKWFAQNAEIEHEKLVSVPIGIANSQWPHGNLALLDSIRAEKQPKSSLVYKNFDSGTSFMRRLRVQEATSLNGIAMAPKTKQSIYLRSIAQSKFNICPLGNGVDCHRTWESLYLDSIPIVEDCPLNRSFKDLPILIVPEDKWSLITKEFLEDQYQRFANSTWKLDKLDLNYWKGRITQGV